MEYNIKDGESFVSNYLDTPPDELYHYGVKGMKWGVRKLRYKINNARYNRNASKVSKAALDYTRYRVLQDRIVRDYKSLKDDPDGDKDLVKLLEEEIDIHKENTYQAYQRLVSAGKNFTDRYGDYPLQSIANEARDIEAGVRSYIRQKSKETADVLRFIDEIEEDLYHHGTKGMKWGRRRYQNPDGSLTPLGRIRYGAGKAGNAVGKAVKGAYQKHKTKVANKKESERIEKLMKKPIKKLTESELAERTALATKQKNLRQIESESNRMAENAKSFVSKFGSKMLNEALVPATVNAGKGAIEKLLSKKLSEALGLNEKDTNEALRKSVESLRLTKEKGELDKYFERGGKDDEATALRKSVETLRLKKEKGDLEKALSGKDNTKEADAKLAEEAARLSNQVKLATAKKTLEKLAKEEAEEEEKKKKKD